MYGEPTNDPRERFIAQFEWDGEEAIYRRDRIGPAYRVTIDDYNRYIDDFDRWQGRARWAVTLVAVVLAGSVLALLMTFYRPGSTTAGHLMPFVGLLPGLVVSLPVYRLIFLIPARDLRRSTPIAPALSGSERLDRTIGKTTWRSLFSEAMTYGLLILVFLIMLFLLRPLGHAGWEGWLLLVVCGAGLLLYVLAQIFRKWLFERRERVADQPLASSRTR